MAFENAVAAGSDATDQYHPVVGETATPETVTPTADTDAPIADTDAPARDEQGRFVPKTETPTESPSEPLTSDAKKGSPQHRINQAVAKQREAERRADAAEARIRRIEAPVSAAPPPVSVPDGEPAEDQFEKYEDYVRAIASYAAKVTIVKEREAAQAAHAQAIHAQARAETQSAHGKRIDIGKATHADFDDVVNREDIPVTAPMEDAIVHSSIGHELMYYLGKNPSEAARIAALPPGPALVAMGRLEAALDVASAPAPTSSAPLSKTPPPIRPISGSTHQSTKALEDLPIRDYMRVRGEQILARRRY